MPIQIINTEQAVRDDGVKVLLYGAAGTGKTTSSITAPAPLILSAESGLLSIRSSRLPVIEVRSYNEVREAYDWFLRAPDARKNVRTIVVDSLSEVLEVVLQNEKAGTRDPRQAYGALIDKGIPLIKSFRDLPGYNVIMIAKEFKATDNFGIIKATPRAPGQNLGIELPYLFDLVARASIGRDQNGQPFHFFQCRADNLAEAKDRSGALEMMEPPHWEYIFSKMRGATFGKMQ